MSPSSNATCGLRSQTEPSLNLRQKFAGDEGEEKRVLAPRSIGSSKRPREENSPSGPPALTVRELCGIYRQTCSFMRFLAVS